MTSPRKFLAPLERDPRAPDTVSLDVMPATFAHPVFAVPFARLKLPLSALIFGSFAPDVGHIIPLALPHAFRHNLTGIFAFALPVGLVLLWLFHRVIKEPLIRMAPRRFQARMTARFKHFDFAPWPRFILVCLAVIAGASTHIIADAFTHWYGWPVQNIAVLRAVVFETRFEPVRVFKCLQYGGSVAGTLVLAWWARSYLRDLIPTKSDPGRWDHFLILSASVALGAFTYALAIASDQAGYWALKIFTVRFVGGACALAFVAFFLYGAANRWRSRAA